MKTSLFGGFSGLLGRMDFDAAAEYVKNLGFDGVEPSPCAAIGTPEKARELRLALEAWGLRVSCLSTCVDLSGYSGEDDAGAVMEDLTLLTDIAAALGSPFLHHTLLPHIDAATAGRAPALLEREIGRVVRRAREICDRAAAQGVVCLYEDQGFVFNGVVNFGRFLDELDHENTGVCLDLGNILFVSEKPEDFAARFAPRIRHVHVKDYHFTKNLTAPAEGWLPTREGDGLQNAVIGRGIVDCEAVFRVLRQAGYEGYYSTECDPSPESLREGLAHMRRAFAAAGK